MLDLDAIDGHVFNGLRIVAAEDGAVVAPTFLVNALCQIELAPIYGFTPPNNALESLAPLVFFPAVSITISFRYLIRALRTEPDVNACLIAAIQNALIARRAFTKASKSPLDWNTRQFSESFSRALVEDSSALSKAVDPDFRQVAFANVALAAALVQRPEIGQSERDVDGLAACLDAPIYDASTQDQPSRDSEPGAIAEVESLLARFRELWG